MIEVIQHCNSGINVFKYKGQKTLQVVGVEKAFTKLHEQTKDNPFSTIIELGSDYGGLTNILADHPLSNSANIHTFDINKQNFISYSDKITFHNKDFYECFEFIRGLIESSGRVLLLCDGGNKKQEFADFHVFLKPDDIIMAHDYVKDRKTFMNEYYGKIWSWHEFEDSYAAFPRLHPFLQDEFEPYVWCIRIKK